MEFPNNLSTNIHIVDSITVIQWARYALEGSRERQSDGDISEECNSNYSDKNSDDEDQILQDAESQLRCGGHHVLYDAKDFGVWVFGISDGTLANGTSCEGESVLRVIRDHNMTKTSSGALQSSDFRGNQNTDMPMIRPTQDARQVQQAFVGVNTLKKEVVGANSGLGKASEARNVDAYLKNAMGSCQSSENIHMIYAKITAAIIRSLLLCEARTGKWLPIGPSSIIGPLASQAIGFPTQNNDWYPHVDVLVVFSLSVQWLPSGTLVIASSPVFESELSRVSDTFFNMFSTSSLPIGTCMTLSPSGKSSFYLGEEVPPNSSMAAKPGDVRTVVNPNTISKACFIEELKVSVVARLARQGIIIQKDVKWLRLRMKRSADSSECIDEMRSYKWQEVFTTLWPAHLCFVEIVKPAIEESDVAHLCKAAKEGSLDPLLHAETWFLAKNARKEAMKAAVEFKRKNDEMEARIVEESKFSGDEDAFSDLNSGTNQYISTQDASRIYPTPPDGLRSQVGGSLVSHELQEAPGEYEDNDLVDSVNDELPSAGSPLHSSPDLSVNTARYEEPMDEDLFEEMDTDLFAATGLTEADFSFFDEPSVDGHDSRGEDQDIGQSRVKYELEEGDIFPIEAIDSPSRGKLDPKEFPNSADQGEHLIKTELSPAQGIISQSLLENESKFSNIEDLSKGPNNKGSAGNSMSEQICDAGNDLIPLLDDNFALWDGKSDGHKGSSFDSVSFTNRVRKFDRKYSSQGRFDFGNGNVSQVRLLPTHPASQEIPLPRLNLQEYGRDPDLREKMANALSQGSPTCTSQDSGESRSSPSEVGSTAEATPSDSSVLLEKILGSDFQGKSVEFGTRNSRKRKRGQDSRSDQPTTPSVLASIMNSNPEVSSGEILHPSSDLFSPAPGPQQYPSSNITSQQPTYTGNDRSFIQIAQISADQRILRKESYEASPISSRQVTAGKERELCEDPLSHIIPTLFTKCETCDLKRYTSVGDGPSENQSGEDSALRYAPKKSILLHGKRGIPMSQTSVFNIKAPYICVRRSGSLIEVSASALHFWEELNFAPVHNGKNVTAFCVYPANDYLRDGAETFLTLVGSAYQSCRLGDHVRGSRLPGYPNGLVPVPIDSHDPDVIVKSITETCRKLATNLSHHGVEGDNIVVYMVNPFKNPMVLPRLCAVFLKTLETYSSMLKSQGLDNAKSLILHIVPLGLVASFETIALPSRATYTKVAFEVYDRCGPTSRMKKSGNSQFLCTPSICLARDLPRSINFKLAPEPFTQPLQSDGCFHLSYSWNVGQSWLAAAWTDNQGLLQWNASFCLGKTQLEPWEAFLDIANEIWETTLEMLQERKISWRIFITKDSRMHKKELDVWLSLSSNSSQPSIACTLLTVDPHPMLRFPKLDTLSKNLNIALNSFNTPVSTPLASTFSPDQTGLVSTPGGVTTQTNAPTPTPTGGAFDYDTEAKLVDVTDETWGVTMARSLDYLPIPVDYCCTLVGGYLVKRAGSRDEDSLVALGVNIIHSQKPDKALLVEILTMYRYLGTLARARGIVEPLHNVLPWHVAAARKAHLTISSTMSWDDD